MLHRTDTRRDLTTSSEISIPQENSELYPLSAG